MDIPDEINKVRVAGSEHPFGARRFGWPFCYGQQQKDKEFNPPEFKRIDISADCTTTEPSFIKLPFDANPAGLAFVSSNKWPNEWTNNLLVAYGGMREGSSGGYKVVRVVLDKDGETILDDNNNPIIEDFISGWYQDEKIHGKPVDLKFSPDGYLFITDPMAGVILRVIPKTVL